MPKIIALTALALLLPLGVVQNARADDAQKFESWRLFDDMRRAGLAGEWRKEQRFQNEQEAKKEEHLHRQRMEAKREGNRHWRDMKLAQVETVDREVEMGEGQKAEDPLLLFAFDGEPSRSEIYMWAQEPPETGTFLFQWTYTYQREDYTASIELDVGFISKDSKTYLALTQESSTDQVDNRYPVYEISPRGIYAAFLNRTGLHFRFNPRDSSAAYYSRFRDIRITRVDHERQEEGN